MNIIRMPQHFVVYEHSRVLKISSKSEFKNRNEEADIFVPKTVFELLKQQTFTSEADTVLQFSVRKGEEQIRFKNYIGILQLADGSRFEVLPKIAQDRDVPTARRSFLKMLRQLPEAPFKSLSTAALSAVSLPVWEIFITAFIEEMEQIARQGIQKAYQTVENEETFVRGKWLPHRQNAIRPELLFTEHDLFTSDILPNRLLKTCVLALFKQSRHLSNQIKLRQLRFIMEGVQASVDFRSDFNLLQLPDRRFDRYTRVLQWAKILLNQQSWAGGGYCVNESLLFPAERLFENYVARGCRNYLAEWEVIYQDSLHFLVEEHAGQRRFGLRPDLVIRRGNKTVVLDVKWKRIEPHLPNYGIEQSDLYQLYAYGRKYHTDELLLIYPAHETFQTPLLPFHFDNQLKLTILPFDLTQSWESEIKKIEASCR
ncbi:MAG: restriction endonuclease [Spirosomataceae bacterium]